MDAQYPYCEKGCFSCLGPWQFGGLNSGLVDTKTKGQRDNGTTGQRDNGTTEQRKLKLSRIKL